MNKMEKIRKAAVAGQFYAGNNRNLRQQIEECFLEKRGPEKIPEISQGADKLIGKSFWNLG